jgi:protein gp37
MGKDSSIEWTHHTFNPWIGCAKVSPGCKNCYAEEMMAKRLGKVQWGFDGERIRTSPANWKKPLAWDKAAEKAGVRHRVFCASLADVFEDKADQREQMDEWRADLFRLIEKTPHLDWLLLTKRPENVNRMIERATGFSDSEMWFYTSPNVWVGTSVENQEQADLRIPSLLDIPAEVRFLSMEPLLGAVTINKPSRTFHEVFALGEKQIGWVIVGGESGRNARPMHPQWARSIRDECVQAGVPFFFKQWGEWAEISQLDVVEEEDWNKPQYTFQDSVFGFTHVNRVGKHTAGRLLDGRVWDEVPQC